jgi:hypothetical protein
LVTHKSSARTKSMADLWNHQRTQSIVDSESSTKTKSLLTQKSSTKTNYVADTCNCQRTQSTIDSKIINEN